MKKFSWVPTLGEVFVAPLYCDNCNKETQHVISLDGFEKQNDEWIVGIECSCGNCSCTLENLGNGQFKVDEIFKKWEDCLPLKEWRKLIISLNP